MKSDYPFKIRHWGKCDYLPLWRTMQTFTRERTETTQDEIWIVEHNPVYTRGPRATCEDIMNPTDIPIVSTDRGGRVTYHGPGQLVIYPLLNLKRLKCHLRMLVDAIETTMIRLLGDYQIPAYAEPKAPGIYIKAAKVASLGLRIHKNYCYHGLAINVAMDLTPFQGIHPCGLKDIAMTHLVDWIGPTSLASISEQFLHHWYQQPFYYQ
jgi:lipoyl(octanoyl) transferase